MNKAEQMIAKIVAVACFMFIITGLMCGIEICTMVGQHISADATVVAFTAAILGAFALMMWALNTLAKEEEKKDKK